MVHNIFPQSPVKTYSVGRNEDIPEEFAALPTVSMEQTHSANFVEITEPNTQKIPDCDALITQLPGVHLKVKHADCMPVLIYHPSGLIAAIHAGRKGTEKGIVQKVLKHISKTDQIKNGLKIWFGPCICFDCYQIDKETDQHYDLISKNRDQVRAVYNEDQAEIIYSDACTAHQNEHFFSYRKEGKGVPMNWSGIAL